MNVLIIPSLITSIIMSRPVSEIPVSPVAIHADRTIATASYSLTNGHQDAYVNQVFADNILLTLAYLGGTIQAGKAVSWDQVRTPATYGFTLESGQSFAFHDQLLTGYQAAVTTKAHFNSQEGFHSDGWLVGDGVCHLASFMKVVADQANLVVTAPTSHSFADIPDVSPADGVSIYVDPNNPHSSAAQNLYITNPYPYPVRFKFITTNDVVTILVEAVGS